MLYYYYSQALVATALVATALVSDQALFPASISKRDHFWELPIGHFLCSSQRSFQSLSMLDLYIRFRTFHKWPALVTTTLSNSRGGRLRELRLYYYLGCLYCLDNKIYPTVGGSGRICSANHHSHCQRNAKSAAPMGQGGCFDNPNVWPGMYNINLMLFCNWEIKNINLIFKEMSINRMQLHVLCTMTAGL